MPKLTEKAFTDTYLRNLKTATRKDHYDAVQRGLGLRVAPSGIKSWFVMRRVDGRPRRFTLGRYPEVGLAAARKKAADLLEDLAAGKEPMKPASLSFAQVFEQWLSRDQAGKRSLAEKERAIRRDVLPMFCNRRIDSITRAEIRFLLDTIVDKGSPIHANRLLAYLKRLFAWAADREIVVSSPIAGMKAPTAERSRDRTLSRSELAAIWNATYRLGEPFGAFFRMLILTGQRRNEVAGATWYEIDLDKREWTIPAARAKNSKSHIVHLSDAVSDTLSAVPRWENGEFVFTSNGRRPVSGFSKAKAALDQVSGVRDWRIHDLRRTFATLATGELGIQPVVVDKILNHSGGAVTGVAAVYQRHAYLDQRREALETWGRYVGDLDDSESGLVPALRGGA